MYDLCSRPEPAPAPTHTGSRGEGEALEPPQQQPKKSEVEEHRGDVTAAGRHTPPSLLGKRHRSLYANLNGLEVDEKHKVSEDQSLLVGDILVQVNKKKNRYRTYRPELQKGA